MAVHYNATSQKLIIEIPCISTDEATAQFKNIKHALIDMVSSINDDLYDKDNNYWMMFLIQNLEPTEEQYALMFGLNTKTNSNKKDWVSVEKLPENFKKLTDNHGKSK